VLCDPKSDGVHGVAWSPHREGSPCQPSQETRWDQVEHIHEIFLVIFSFRSETYLNDDPERLRQHEERSRYVDRDGQFYQSEGLLIVFATKTDMQIGDFSVRRKVLIEDVLGLFYAGDPVLFLVNMKTWHCCVTLLIIYLIGSHSSLSMSTLSDSPQNAGNGHPMAVARIIRLLL
jgi:hypothetical protein